jgi:DNA-binding MarR family transcriptional regulator
MSRREPAHTPEGKAGSDLIVSTFRTNGLLLAAGDVLTEEFGLTAARWQVLGAIVFAHHPLTVPQIARRMGLTRQSVHSTVKRLAADGIVQLADNADHRRSQLVSLTELGQAKYRALDQKQAEWVNELVGGLSHAELETAARVLDELCRRLEVARVISHDQEGLDE